MDGNENMNMRTLIQQGPMVQWLTRPTTDQKVLGSTPCWLGKLSFSFIFLGTFFKRILKQFLKSFESIFVEVILHLCQLSLKETSEASEDHPENFLPFITS